jgi:hypothetical protein
MAINNLKPPHNNTQLKEIGLTTIYFSMLENVITSLLLEVIDNKKFGHIIISDLSIRQKISLLNSLYKAYRPNKRNLQNELNRTLFHIEDCVIPARNKIIHSTWGPIKSSRSVNMIRKKASTRKGYTKTYTKMNTTDFKSINYDIIDSYNKMISFMSRMHEF